MQMKDQEGRAVEDSEEDEEGATKDPQEARATEGGDQEGERGGEGGVDSDVDRDADNDVAASVYSDGERGGGVGSGLVSDVNVDEKYVGAGAEVGRGVPKETAPAFASGGLAAGGADSEDIVPSVNSEVGGGAKVRRNKTKRKKNRNKDRRASSPPGTPVK